MNTKKFNKRVFLVLAVVSVLMLAFVAFLPESCGGLKPSMRFVALLLVFPPVFAYASAKIYMSLRR